MCLGHKDGFKWPAWGAVEGTQCWLKGDAIYLNNNQVWHFSERNHSGGKTNPVSIHDKDPFVRRASIQCQGFWSNGVVLWLSARQGQFIHLFIHHWLMDMYFRILINWSSVAEQIEQKQSGFIDLKCSCIYASWMPNHLYRFRKETSRCSTALLLIYIYIYIKNKKIQHHIGGGHTLTRWPPRAVKHQGLRWASADLLKGEG